jgi:hypothetical protein
MIAVGEISRRDLPAESILLTAAFCGKDNEDRAFPETPNAQTASTAAAATLDIGLMILQKTDFQSGRQRGHTNDNA